MHVDRYPCPVSTLGPRLSTRSSRGEGQASRNKSHPSQFAHKVSAEMPRAVAPIMYRSLLIHLSGSLVIRFPFR